MGRRARITASSQFVSHRMRSKGIYATASRESNSGDVVRLHPGTVKPCHG
jgi:hypothetical protein